MGFDAGKAVSPMDWDFTAFGGKKGTVPEPSQEAFTIYQREAQEASKDVIGFAGKKLSDLSREDLARLSEVDLQKINEETKAAIAKLCQNQPSIDDLNMLPHRVLQAFQKWLQEEFDPEGVGAGTTNLRVVRTGA